MRLSFSLTVLFSRCCCSGMPLFIMRLMKQKHIDRLEAQLERLVESAFASMFGKRIRARDISLHLARAMETHAFSSHEQDRPLAPDMYNIHLCAETRDKLLEQEPQLPAVLSGHIVELAMVLGYQLVKVPVVQITADDQLAPGNLTVFAKHTEHQADSTVAMRPVEAQVSLHEESVRFQAQLVIGNGQAVMLTDGVVNIGRERDNHVVIDDPYVSRHHVQLRFRHDGYLLFDVSSNSGTLVNGVRVREHRLQPGDVILIGKTQLLYLDQNASGESSDAETQSLDPYSSDE